MSRIPDLVQDTRLDTTFDDRYTVHHHDDSDDERNARSMRRAEVWQWEHMLARGGCGEVWLQRCVQGGRSHNWRAVKVVPRETQVHYISELEAIAKFSQKRYSKCFVKLFGWYTAGTSLCIAMEYFPLGDLQKQMSSGGPIAHDDVRDICFQIMEGLHYMHREGFAHRDIKPGNVLVKSRPPASSWWVKLSDFGISKRLEESMGQLSTVKGTVSYMAPELLGHEPGSPVQIDYMASDMWSAGEMTFRMLTKSATFSSHRALLRYLDRPDLFPSQEITNHGGSEDAASFIRQLMQPSPESRLRSGQALEHPWLRLYSQQCNQSYTQPYGEPGSTLTPPAIPMGSPSTPNVTVDNHQRPDPWATVSSANSCGLHPSAAAVSIPAYPGLSPSQTDQVECGSQVLAGPRSTGMRDQLTSTFKKPLWNDQDKSAKTEQPRASKLLAPESSVALGEVGYVPAFSPTSSIVQEQRQVPDRQQPPLAHPPKQPTVGDGENESIIATRALSSNAAVLSISHDEAQLITRIHDNISTIPRTPPVPGRVLKCRFAVNGREIRDYDFTPDNRHLVMAHASYSALYMAGITVHDAHYGYWVRQIATNGRQFHHMALSDKFAAFASMMGGLDIWSLPGWHRVGGLGGQILVALAWWDDEKILMSAASDIIKIWGTGSLETDGSLTELCALQRPSEWSTIQHAAISHRGLVGALCKSEIRLWAPDASNREWLFLATVWSEAPYHDFCFARRGGRIICCTETYVEMVRITDSSVVWRTYMSSIAMGVAASMNGKHLAVSCEDRVAILDWTGRIVVDLAGPGLKSENRKAKFCGKDQLVASLVSNEQVAVWKY